MERDRNPVSEVLLLPEPPRASSSSRRGKSQRSLLTRACGVANRALLAVRQLDRGKLDDSLLGTEPKWGCPKTFRETTPGGKIASNFRKLCMERPPPSEMLSPDAALSRLRGERGMGLAVSESHTGTYQQTVERLRTKALKDLILPRRGDLFPAHWEHVALPKPGSKPVDICTVSARCREHLTKVSAMLHEDWEKRIEDSTIKPYEDPHFSDPENLYQLALRMGRANMLRRSKQCKGQVRLFTVVKKAEGVGEDLIVHLRLIFDQRRENLGWRDPPWISLGGLASLAQLDISKEVNEDGMRPRYAAGDVPDYYWVLGLPEELSEHFTLQNVDTERLAKQLAEEGYPLEGSGNYIGMKVPPMGFSWAVYLAQTTMEDIFDSGQESDKMLLPTQRVADGGPLPSLNQETPVAHFQYVDDFGIVGLGSEAVADQDHPIEPARSEARQLLRKFGFDVHKEGVGDQLRMVGGDFDRTRVYPNHEKLWLTIAATEGVLARRKVESLVVEALVGCFTWFFLLNRAALSIFSEVYTFCRLHRGQGPVTIPMEVKRELAAAAAIGPIVYADLARPWHHTAYLFDASHLGGAVVESPATLEELRSPLDGDRGVAGVCGWEAVR